MQCVVFQALIVGLDKKTNTEKLLSLFILTFVNILFLQKMFHVCIHLNLRLFFHYLKEIKTNWQSQYIKTFASLPLPKPNQCNMQKNNQVDSKLPLAHPLKNKIKIIIKKKSVAIKQCCSYEDEAVFDFRVARARFMLLDHLPLAVTVTDVDGCPGCDVAVNSVAHTAHADLTVHGHWLAFDAHSSVFFEGSGPLRVLAVFLGVRHPVLATVSAT